MQGIYGVFVVGTWYWCRCGFHAKHDKRSIGGCRLLIRRRIRFLLSRKAVFQLESLDFAICDADKLVHLVATMLRCKCTQVGRAEQKLERGSR